MTSGPKPAGSTGRERVFDFAAFRHAFTQQDLATWIAFFADDAQWIEYRHGDPPAAPRMHVGRAQIAQFLVRVKGSKVTLAIEDEVIGPERCAFRVWCTLPDGRRIVEHVIIQHADGLITRQVDVEAWD